MKLDSKYFDRIRIRSRNPEPEARAGQLAISLVAEGGGGSGLLAGPAELTVQRLQYSTGEAGAVARLREIVRVVPV